jgi:hypothetical protein
MSRDGALNYQREAVAAMRLAAAATGCERIRWIRIAQAWQDMAQWTEQRDILAAARPSLRQSTADPSVFEPSGV